MKEDLIYYTLAKNGQNGMPTIGLLPRLLDITPFVVIGEEGHDNEKGLYILLLCLIKGIFLKKITSIYFFKKILTITTNMQYIKISTSSYVTVKARMFCITYIMYMNLGFY